MAASASRPTVRAPSPSASRTASVCRGRVRWTPTIRASVSTPAASRGVRRCTNAQKRFPASAALAACPMPTATSAVGTRRAHSARTACVASPAAPPTARSPARATPSAGRPAPARAHARSRPSTHRSSARIPMMSGAAPGASTTATARSRVPGRTERAPPAACAVTASAAARSAARRAPVTRTASAPSRALRASAGCAPSPLARAGTRARPTRSATPTGPARRATPPRRAPQVRRAPPSRARAASSAATRSLTAVTTSTATTATWRVGRARRMRPAARRGLPRIRRNSSRRSGTSAPCNAPSATFRAVAITADRARSFRFFSLTAAPCSGASGAGHNP
mmetsp:Transcript_36762/g.113387  ORF Transcript_36762/g.113387 Transcript_36762/m.113387 type:complete len:338 (-) Transcript_36762:27-1040(-)